LNGVGADWPRLSGRAASTVSKRRAVDLPLYARWRNRFELVSIGVAGHIEIYDPVSTVIKSKRLYDAGSEPLVVNRIFSAVMGSERIHTPVAAAIALAMVAGGSMHGGSPTPLAP
jgi:hypothetical protein